MTSDVRQFDNYRDMGGFQQENVYMMPELKYNDSYGHVRVWRIYARLVKDGKQQSNIDWNIMEEDEIVLEDKYYGSHSDFVELPKYVISETWTETGVVDGKITRSIPTYFSGILMEGQINQRHAWHQALVHIRALYLKRREKLGSTVTIAATTTSNVSELYYPMLATKYLETNITYPVYVQPKLDGLRCIACLRYAPKDIVYVESLSKNAKCKYIFDIVALYTRSLKMYPSYDYIKLFLYPYLADLYDHDNKLSIYLDGEIYKHGRSLQDISGDSRNSIVDKPVNKYYIYDCFYPDSLDISYEERKTQLDEMFHAMESNADVIEYEFVSGKGNKATDVIMHMKIKNWIINVNTILANDEAEVDSIFKTFISNDYEGVILRNINGEYLANTGGTESARRSKDLIKKKKLFSDEFKIVGYTEGSRGKDKGAIIWILETKEGLQFNVVPKGITYDEKRRLFNLCNTNDGFNKKYLGLMMTVEYEALSNDKVPLRAQAVGVRNF